MNRATQLTAKQSQVLRFISSQSRQGRVPTVREIADHFQIASPNGAMCHLIALERKGFIRLPHDRSKRVIQVVGQVRRRSDIEQRLYDALQALLSLWNEYEETGLVPLQRDRDRVREQVYEAINAADDGET